MSDSYYAGLDIGGTTIKAMLLDQGGKRVGEIIELRSHGHEGYERTLGQLELALDQVAASAKQTRDAVKAVGVDVPAPCSDGRLMERANLHADWAGVHFRDIFAQRVSKPVYMTNDGNAAAYGEYVMRPGIKSGLLLVAPGTGLGGGLVLPGGILYEGANGVALEIGSVSVPFREDGELPKDNSGREGNIEAWVSLIAVRRQLAKKLTDKANASHPLNQENTPIEEKAFRLRDFCEKGDPLAREIFQHQAYVLGWFLGDQASMLDPGLIVVGGGIAETKFRDWYMGEIIKGFEARAEGFYVRSPFPPNERTTTFEWAIGGDAAAAFGVAHKALQLFGKS